MNSFQQPNSDEPSCGTFHPRDTDPIVWDVNARTADTLASPYTWDLSSILPVGTNAVEITLVIHINQTANYNAGQLQCWQYELGVSPGVAAYGPKGLHVRVSKGVAANYTHDQIHAANDGKIVLGASRKLYIGHALWSAFEEYAMWKGYYL